MSLLYHSYRQCQTDSLEFLKFLCILYQHALISHEGIMNTCLRPYHCSCQKPIPSKIISLLFAVLLVVIHTADMELTKHYIGNDWQREAFLPMSLCIKYFGVIASVWISRLIIYPLLFLYFINWKRWSWHYFLITCTILYWTSMIGWLETLGITVWPH